MKELLNEISDNLMFDPEKNIRLILSRVNDLLKGSLTCVVSGDISKIFVSDSSEYLNIKLRLDSFIIDYKDITGGIKKTIDLISEKEIVKSLPFANVKIINGTENRSFALITFYHHVVNVHETNFESEDIILRILSLEIAHFISISDNETRDDIYKTAFDNANDAILLLKDDIIVNCNKKSCDLFGYEINELRGKSTEDLTPKKVASDEDISLNKQGYSNRALTGEPQMFEWLHQKKDGLLIYTEITLNEIKGSKDYDLLAIVRDISQRKEYEKLLKEQKEKADETSRLKSLSLASMSHELRTPLNSIIGFSDLLLDEDTTEDEKEMFSRLIHTAGKSLMQLIGDIVDISKIEAGKVMIQKTVFEVNTFLKDIYLTFQHEKKLKNVANVELKLVLSDKTSEIKLKTDEHRLRQVFSNLLTNSLKFIDNGYIEFGYLCLTYDFIQFYVKDTGVGIDTRERGNIFEQYGQDKTTYNRNKEGTGLGLAISRSFVELLGGKIWLDSEMDKGSTFYFTIPVENNLGNLPDTGKYNVDWSGKTILIVDDVKENYVFMNGLLGPTKAKVLWSVNGKEAVDLCIDHKNIDCVLMDIRMPVMDGYESVKLIRDKFPGLLIIAQTAFATAEDRDKCLAGGFDYYFPKPVNFVELFKVIVKHLGKN